MADPDPESLSAALLLWLRSLRPPTSTDSSPELDTSAKGKARELEDIRELCDGETLWSVCGSMDASFFRNPRPVSSSTGAGDNWVLRFNSLKRLYKLVISYFEERLQKSTVGLTPVPNLQKIAKDSDVDSVTSLTLLILTLACEVAPDVHVPKILALQTWAQKRIRSGLEDYRARLVDKTPETHRAANTDDQAADDEFYNLQHDRSRLLSEKDSLDQMYAQLLAQFRSLQGDHDEALKKLESTESQLSDALTARAPVAGTGADEVRAELEVKRLKADLARIEDELAVCESSLEARTKEAEDVGRRCSELEKEVERGEKVKDELEEMRFATERLRKSEAVVEKYKRKLEDSADLRRQLKALEDQNVQLLDKNSLLEEQYSKVSAFKPLMESYKSRIAELESSLSSTTRAKEEAEFEAERGREKIRVLEEEREREREESALVEERVRELEGAGKKGRRLNGDDDDGEEDEDGGDLEDAMAGRTTTDLRLQIRQLQRSLAEAQSADSSKADSSRLVVLENLLEDAQRMKRKYEGDYLRECREKLVARAKLEEILSGKSKLGDGPEAAIALRQRLNETVEELDKLKQEHLEATVRFEAVDRELTIARSDLNLVNKDQLDVLHSLRESVAVEKAGLESEVSRLQGDLKSLQDKTTMQASQIQSLLLEKVDLQADGIGQREQAIEREREVGRLKPGGMGREEEERLKGLERRIEEGEERERKMKEKLRTARDFIREQDEMIQSGKAEKGGMSDEDRQMYETEIETLKLGLERQKVLHDELEVRYQRELRLMSTAWHHLGQQRVRDALTPSSGAGGGRAGPQGWLGQQRQRTMGRSLIQR